MSNKQYCVTHNYQFRSFSEMQQATLKSIFVQMKVSLVISLPKYAFRFMKTFSLQSSKYLIACIWKASRYCQLSYVPVQSHQLTLISLLFTRPLTQQSSCVALRQERMQDQLKRNTDCGLIHQSQRL